MAAESELLVVEASIVEGNWFQFQFCCLRKHWLHQMQKSNLTCSPPLLVAAAAAADVVG